MSIINKLTDRAFNKLNNNIKSEPNSEVDLEDDLSEKDKRLYKDLIAFAYLNNPYQDLLEEAMEEMDERLVVSREWWQKYSNLTGKESTLNDGHGKITPNEDV